MESLGTQIVTVTQQKRYVHCIFKEESEFAFYFSLKRLLDKSTKIEQIFGNHLPV